MLRFSYKVLLKEYEAKRLALLIDLERDPFNKRAIEALNKLEMQISWLKDRIKNGLDPGVRIV